MNKYLVLVLLVMVVVFIHGCKEPPQQNDIEVNVDNDYKSVEETWDGMDSLGSKQEYETIIIREKKSPIYPKSKGIPSSNVTMGLDDTKAELLIMQLDIAEQKHDIVKVLELYGFPVKRFFEKRNLSHEELKLEYTKRFQNIKQFDCEIEKILSIKKGSEYHFTKDCFTEESDIIIILYKTCLKLRDGKIVEIYEQEM